METLFFVHLSTDTLEEYAFNRLSETEAESLEEHLLVCRTCQASLAEVDEYIFLMKAATAGYQPAMAPKGRLERSAWLKTALMGYAAGAIALAATLFLILSSRTVQPTSEVSRVPLFALRGGGPSTNHAGAGRPLELVLDTTGLANAGGLTTADGLPAASGYRVEVIDATGKPAWSGEIPACAKPQGEESCGAPGGPLTVRVTGGLKAGVYWVRLYAGGQLLREFGLQTD